MGKFLHSLPWTLALALAQAGETGPSRPVEEATLSHVEEGVTPEELPRIPRVPEKPFQETDLSLED